MREYHLYIAPNDEAPYRVIPESAVSQVPTGRPETIDIRDEDSNIGSVILRFRPMSPTSYKCYLIAMLSEYHDGWLNRFSRSL